MRTSVLCTVFLLTFTIFSCSSDDSGKANTDGGLSIADIQGNWTATSFVFEKSCDPGMDCPAESVDLIDQGITATMMIESDGQFTILSTQPGGGGEAISGQMSFDEDLLVITFDDSPGEDDFFGVQLTNNDNNLRIEGPVEYDFDMDGNDEPATVTITLVRS